jgi:hypothetical protein
MKIMESPKFNRCIYRWDNVKFGLRLCPDELAEVWHIPKSAKQIQFELSDLPRRGAVKLRFERTHYRLVIADRRPSVWVARNVRAWLLSRFDPRKPIYVFLYYYE